jgi:DNA-binding NtrC family response regulator
LQSSTPQGRGQSRREITLSLDQPLEAMVEEIVEAVIVAELGNQTRAAERLGISVRTIQRRAVPAYGTQSSRPARGGARAGSSQRRRT